MSERMKPEPLFAYFASPNRFTSIAGTTRSELRARAPSYDSYIEARNRGAIAPPRRAPNSDHQPAPDPLAHFLRKPLGALVSFIVVVVGLDLPESIVSRVAGAEDDRIEVRKPFLVCTWDGTVIATSPVASLTRESDGAPVSRHDLRRLFEVVGGPG